MNREQLTKVRDALWISKDATDEEISQINEALAILDRAIAAPVQEPVAYWDGESLALLPADLENIPNWSDYYRIPLYRHPREWQGLSDEEIEHTMNNVRPCEWQGSFNQAFARAIEAALCAKNTGEQA